MRLRVALTISTDSGLGKILNPSSSGVMFGSGSKLQRTPEIPAGHASIGAPAFGSPAQGRGLGQLTLAERQRKPFSHPQISQWQYVGPSQLEDQQHLHRPPAYAAHSGEPLHDLLVLHAAYPGQRRNGAIERASGEVLQRRGLRGREAGGPQLFGWNLEQVQRGGEPLGREQPNDPAQNGGGRFAGELLVDNRSDEHLEQTVGRYRAHGESSDP